MEAFARLDEWGHQGDGGGLALAGLAELTGFVAHRRVTLCGQGLANEGLAGFGRVLGAGLGVEQAEEVVDLGDRGHGRLAAAAGNALLDGDGRRQPGDAVDVRALHLLDELPGVGGHAVEEPPLALGEQDVEGEGGFAGAGQAGDDDELIARYLEVDVLQVVLAGAANFYEVRRRGDRKKGRGGDSSTGGSSSGIVRDGFFSDSGELSGGGAALLRGTEDGAEVLAGVGGFYFGDLFGGAFGDDLAAVAAGFGAEVDEVIGGLDDLEVVFDDQEGIAGFDETVEDLEQHGDVVEVQAGGGFVENEQVVGLVAPGLSLGEQVGDELEALGLAAAEGVEGLAEAQVAEADIGEDLEGVDDADGELVAGVEGEEELDRFADGRAEHLKDVFSFELDTPGPRGCSGCLRIRGR